MDARPLSFSQRTGIIPLPRQLRSNELSAELRAQIWANLYSFIEEDRTVANQAWIVGGEAQVLLKHWFIEGEFQPIDEYNPSFVGQTARLKELIYNQPIHKLFDFIEFLFRSRNFPLDRKRLLRDCFEQCLAAWRIVDGQFLPISSQEEAQAVSNALADVKTEGPKGAQAHLRLSADHLSKGKWADSVRESVHAVEATAKSLDPGKTLADVLKNLRRGKKPIHPALVDGFLAIYGYTSDEKGVRHSMVDAETADVGEKEALFMFGSCASFAQYLLKMARNDDRQNAKA